jgi:putative salt-induced outer membrane protein YdiY
MKITGLLRVALLLSIFTFNLHAETVILTNGDTLNGKVINRTKENLTLLHPVLGELTIPTTALKTPAETHDSEETGHKSVTEAKPKGEAGTKVADNGIFDTSWLTDWKYQLQAGVSGSSGKSDDQKINIGFSANYEDRDKRWTHKTSYYRNESDGDLSDHTLVATLNRDFLLPGDPRFYFAGGQFDYDEFKDFDYRLAVNGGMGYEFFKSSTWRLLGRAGLGINRTYGGTREETVTEGLLQLESKWKINSQQSLDFSNILHPNFSDSGEYRNISTLDWKLQLDKEYGMGLVIGFSNEYDSLNEESDKNDFKYHMSLSISR